MESLKIIRDADLGLTTETPSHYEERSAARAIIFDTQKNIALLHVTKKHYHKLPGGGVEKEESPIEALRREAHEEIGCEIDTIKELGIIEEYRNRESLHQTSYCYTATVVGNKGRTKLEAGEIADGFENVWLTLNEAITVLKSETNIEDYEGKFIRVRDLTFLEAAEKNALSR